MTNTVVDFAVYAFLTRIVSVHPQIANILGFLAGALNSYVLNGQWTFQNDRTALLSLYRVLRFAGVTLACLMGSSLTLFLLLNNMPDLMAKAMATAVTLLIGYWLNRTLVFSR